MLSKTKQRIIAALVFIIFLFTNTIGAFAATGKLFRFSDSEIKVYWTEKVNGKTTTANVAKNYFTVNGSTAYCLDHGYEASAVGVAYDKIMGNLSKSNHNRLVTLFLNGYPQMKSGDKPLGHSLSKNNHVRMGTQIAIWRLLKDIGSPSAKGKVFAFSGTNSYYNKKSSNNKESDKVVEYAKSLYNKAKKGTSITWNKVDSSSSVKKTVTNSPISGTIYRKGPYKVKSSNPGAEFTLTLYKGTSSSTTTASTSMAIITDANRKRITSTKKMSPGDKYWIDIAKKDANKKQKFTVKQKPTSGSKTLDFDIYKCSYVGWQRLISTTAGNMSTANKTVSVTWGTTTPKEDFGQFNIIKTRQYARYNLTIPLAEAEFEWFAWSEKKGRYLNSEEMDDFLEDYLDEDADDEPDDNVLVTDEKGEVKSPRVQITDDNKGKIKIEETYAPSPALISPDSPWEIVLKKDTTIKLEVEDPEEYYRLKIEKKDSDTGELIKHERVRFKLYDEEGDQLTQVFAPEQVELHNLYEGYTGAPFFDEFYINPETGDCTFGSETFSPGIYFLQEIEAGEGYVLPLICLDCENEFSAVDFGDCPDCGSDNVNAQMIEFYLDGEENGSTITIEMFNQKEHGQALVRKTVNDLDGFPFDDIGEFEFSVYSIDDVDTSGNTPQLKPEAQAVDTFTLDGDRAEEGEDGETFEAGVVEGLSKNLGLGEYYIKETKAPAYIQLDPQLYYADLQIHGTIAEFNIDNRIARGSLRIIKQFEGKTIPVQDVRFSLSCISTLSGIKFADLIGKTDENGTLTFENLPYGTFKLTELSDDANIGYHMLEQELIIDKTEELSITLENKLMKGSIKVIKTFEGKDTPIENVEFKLSAISTISGAAFEDQIKKTDENGEVVFDELPWGDFLISELAGENNLGYHLMEQEITIDKTEQLKITMDNELQRGSLKVIKEFEGKTTPVEGITFTLESVSLLSGTEQVTETGVTDEKGELTFDGLPLGTFRIFETASEKNIGYDMIDQEIVIDKTEELELTLTNLLIKGSLKVIKEFEGKTVPVEGVEFQIESTSLVSDSEPVVRIGATNSGGELLFDSLPLGEYKIFELQGEKNAGYYMLDQKLTIDKTEQLEIRLTNLLMKGSLKVIKEFEGKTVPVEGVEFQVESISLISDSEPVTRTGATDPNGELIFDSLPLGNYRIFELQGEANTGYEMIDQEIIIDKTEELELTMNNLLKKGSLKIIKEFQGKTSPVAGVKFVISGTGTAGFEFNMTKKTDSGGIIVIDNIPVGTYTVAEIANNKTRGYQLVEDKEVVITENMESLLTLVNKKIPVTPIKPAKPYTPGNPKTGDESNLTLYLIIALISLCTIGGIIIVNRKMKRKRK